MTIQEKELPLGGKTFIIKKFTPEVGCLWAFKFLGNVASLDGKGFAEKVQNFVNLITKDDAEFGRFRKACLSHVSVKIEPNGFFPVLDEMGGLTAGDLTTPMVVQLILEAFMFTISDFFDQALIKGLWETVLGSFQKPGTETSSSSP